MFHLHVSNRTEHLLRHLAEVLKVSERRSLFEKEVFLIQSPGMERMISQYLADVFRSWCNFSYLLPVDFLSLIAKKLGIPLSPDGFDRRIMIWRIDEQLRHLDEDVYLQVANYLQGPQADLKRYQLARQLANIFDQYQVMRLDMLAGWEKGISAIGSKAELWQIALWQRLCSQLQDISHRGALLRSVIEMLLQEKNLSPLLPQRVSIFGLHTMPPLFLEYFNALSRHVDIHLYTLSPCRHYWGDIETRRLQLQRKLQAKEMTNLEEQFVVESHPLLSSLGQQGRDFQMMLLEKVEFKLEFESFTSPLNGCSPSLLKYLQHDLLEGKVVKEQTGKFSNDVSVQIASCHSKMREVTILKDYLLDLLHHDGTLELRDIVVMAPDIQEYATLIPAIFDDIQHSIADSSMRRRNRYISAFLDFLHIFQGRFGWSEVLDLMHKEVVFPNFDLTESDLQVVQKWVIDSGVRWGLSAHQRGEMGLPELTECSWRAGLDRLLLGYAFSGEKGIEDILPYSGIEGGAAQALGGLCQFMDIFERAEKNFKQKQSMEEWSKLLLGYCEELFGVGDSKDLLELQGILAGLETIYGRFHDSSISYDVIQAWLIHTTEESISSSGFMRGQLTFCSMLPMRSIPFKVVCLMGLNDGIFPKADKWATFDLMGDNYRPGDRSRRGDDRYQFLEAILAARENLYISYLGQSIVTNEAVPPSVMVTEFLELLEDFYGVVEKVVEHPLHPFNSRYFKNEETQLYSYSKNHRKTAETLKKGAVKKNNWWLGNLDVETREISLDDLLQFYSNPQRFFIRNCLDIRLEGEVDLPADREAFVLNPLDEYMINQDVVKALVNGENPEKLLSYLHHQGRWPLGNPGKLSYAKRVEEISSFAEGIQSLEMGKRIADVSIDLVVGGYNLRGTLGNLYEKGSLLTRYARLKGKDLLCGWLYYLLLSRLEGVNKHTLIVSMDAQHCFFDCQPKPDLEKYVHHFVEGCRRPSPLYLEPAFAYAKQEDNKRANISPLEKAEATLQQRLENGYEPEWELLLSGMEGGRYLGEEFEQLCHEFIIPVWKEANARRV